MVVLRTAFLLLAAAGLYRPLVLWADNAWEVQSPVRLLLVGLGIALGAAVPFVVLVRFGLNERAASIAAAGGLIVTLNWNVLQPNPQVWLALLVVFAWIAHRFLPEEALKALIAFGFAALFLAPAVQVVVAHIQQRVPYPIVELGPRGSASATGDVEDVIVVVVDSYPSLTVAQEWFSHDVATVGDHLHTLGYTVLSSGWSQHTSTGLVIPSLMELRPITDPGPKGGWGHRMSTYDIIRGESLVAGSLASAGYEYSHIESGWEAGACGRVDACLEAPWLDELMWGFLRPSIVGDPMSARLGSHTVGNSIRAVEHVESLSSRIGDGRRDFLFAHLLLPHPPYVVNSNCEVVDEELRSEWTPETSVTEQLACADWLITRVAGVAGPSTAIIITGDHGTATQGQGRVASSEWSDAAIAERLGVFLSYRLPDGCAHPESAVNVDVMRSIMECAVIMDLPERDDRFMVGADAPSLVAGDRMKRIQAQVASGSVPKRSG